MHSRTQATLVYNDEHFTQIFGDSGTPKRIHYLHSEINNHFELPWQRMYWNKEFYPADLVIADMKPGVLAWRI